MLSHLSSCTCTSLCAVCMCTCRHTSMCAYGSLRKMSSVFLYCSPHYSREAGSPTEPEATGFSWAGLLSSDLLDSACLYLSVLALQASPANAQLSSWVLGTRVLSSTWQVPLPCEPSPRRTIAFDIRKQNAYRASDRTFWKAWL